MPPTDPSTTGTDAGRRVDPEAAGMDAEALETGTVDLDPAQIKRLRNAALIVYVLQALSLMLGFTLIIGAVISHWKLRAAGDTWLASHFRWQILTFWLFFMWAMFGALTLQLVIGYPVVIGAVGWLVYRFVKGWWRLNTDEPMGV